jgi:hypothetical protein
MDFEVTPEQKAQSARTYGGTLSAGTSEIQRNIREQRILVCCGAAILTARNEAKSSKG